MHLLKFQQKSSIFLGNTWTISVLFWQISYKDGDVYLVQDLQLQRQKLLCLISSLR